MSAGKRFDPDDAPRSRGKRRPVRPGATGGRARNLDERRVNEFRALVLAHYRAHGRDDLPWRATRDPYRVLVSEFMLQQTQVPRVLRRYDPFIRRFPDFETLARSPLRVVLLEWSGLGYNRRALLLRETARVVAAESGGRLPRGREALLSLPGVGPATAAAVCAFAFGEAHPFIETNIRSAFIHHFFRERRAVGDAEIMPLVEATLDRRDPRRWYWALMDYGAALKKRHGNPSRRSAHRTVQPRFEGSTRQARGLVVRALARGARGERALEAETGLDRERLRAALDALEREGMVARRGRRLAIAAR
jgi:A/G-specific adenine glycosylase